MTIKKKIAAVVATAMMALSITMISASAAQETYKSKREEFEGYMVSLAIGADIYMQIQQAFTIYDYPNYDGKAEVRSHLRVVDYYTGKTLGDDYVIDNDSSLMAIANCYVMDSPISLFSAHQVFPNGNTARGYYMDLLGVSQ